MTARAPVHAGTFYPAGPAAIRAAMARAAGTAREAPGRPAAILAPHAGWRYCVPVMATALGGLRGRALRRVIHLGPAHYGPLEGIVASGAAAFETPLGAVPVTEVPHPAIRVDPAPHAPEHALEVQLPFLQALSGPFEYIPLLVGAGASPVLVEVLEALEAASPDVLTVVSSDLSHGLSPEAARAADRATLRAIEALEPGLDTAQACAAPALDGLIAFARRRGWSAMALDRRDTGGGGSQGTVVGYGAAGFYGRG